MRKISFTLVSLLICYALKAQDDAVYPNGVYTQQDITKRTHEIGGVSVKGERPVREAGLTMTTIDSVGLTEASGASFSDLLTKHSTLFVKTHGMGSMATISFRGTGASHTRVEWNGLTINNPMLGQVDFSQIPVWFADRVELYHGGSSLAVGPGALGGAVIINSAPKWGNRLYGDIVQGVGSYGLSQTYVSVGGGSDRVHARIRYLYERAENNFSFKNTDRIGSPWMRQENADYSKHGATVDLYLNAGKGNMLSLNAWVNAGERNCPPQMVSSNRESRIETLDDNDLRIAVGWAMHSPKIRTKLTSGFQSLSSHYIDNNISANNIISSTESSATGFLNRYSMEVDIAEYTVLKFMLNADYHMAKIVDRKKPYPENTNRPDRFETGAGLSLHHKFSTRLSAFASLRGEMADGDTDPLMPSFGVEYAPTDDGALVFKLNAARNYHRPTLNDLYWKPGGNKDLKPERGYTADIVAEYTRKSGNMAYSTSLAGYSSWINDWIIWQPAQGVRGYWSASNRKKVFSRGIEAYASVGYSAGLLKARLNANYAYTRSTNEKVYDERDKSKGKQLVYVPLHKTNVMLDTSYDEWYLWWVWSSVSERFINESNDTSGRNLPAYDLHDLTVGRKLTLWSTMLDVQLKVNNVFGRIYHPLPSRPMPRQHITFIVKLSF